MVTSNLARNMFIMGGWKLDKNFNTSIESCICNARMDYTDPGPCSLVFIGRFRPISCEYYSITLREATLAAVERL